MLSSARDHLIESGPVDRSRHDDVANYDAGRALQPVRARKRVIRLEDCIYIRCFGEQILMEAVQVKVGGSGSHLEIAARHTLGSCHEGRVKICVSILEIARDRPARGFN